MADLDYQRMLADTKTELQSLQTAKANLETQLTSVNARIDAMTKTYNAIAPLLGEQPIPGIMDTLINAGLEVLMTAGISVAVRSVLDAAPHESFTAAIMRDRLAAQGWDWGKYTNPLSTVHTVLVRLVESKAAKEGTTPEGTKCFYSAKVAVQPPLALKLTTAHSLFANLMNTSIRPVGPPPPQLTPDFFKAKK